MNPSDLPLVVTGAGATLCLLGFVALLLQRLYLDPPARRGHAATPSVVKLPGFGEVSTTYPALAFLLVGAALMAGGLAAPQAASKVMWHVTVQVAAELRPEDLVETGLALSPSPMTTTVDRRARTIRITAPIEHGKKFEDVVEVIDLTLPRGSGYVHTREALARFRAHGAASGGSGLVAASDHTRSYTLALTPFPAPLEEALP